MPTRPDASGRRRRRDRARLSLRLRAARRPAGGLRRPDRAGARAGPAGDHSHARGRPTTRSRSCGSEGAAARGVMHCFSGTLDEARAALDLGFYISLSGIVTFPKAETLARGRRVRPGRSAARRDRRAVSRAGAASRQTQRTGVGGRRGERSPALRGVAAAPVAAQIARNFARAVMRSSASCRTTRQRVDTPAKPYGLIPQVFQPVSLQARPIPGCNSRVRTGSGARSSSPSARSSRASSANSPAISSRASS